MMSLLFNEEATMIKAGLSDNSCSEVMLENNTYVRIKNLAQKRNSTIIIPIGSIEQHSTHLPVGTDYIIAYKLAVMIACRILNRYGIQVYVAPPIPYSLSIEWKHKNTFTITLSLQTFSNLIYEIVSELISHGFKNIVLFNGHGGNTEALNIIARWIANSQADKSIKIYVVNWWDLIRDELSTLTEQKTLLHAGEVETSIALTLNIPVEIKNLDYVDTDKMPWTKNGYTVYTSEYPRNKAWGKPHLATKEKGQKIVEAILSKMEKILLNITSSKGQYAKPST